MKEDDLQNELSTLQTEQRLLQEKLAVLQSDHSVCQQKLETKTIQNDQSVLQTDTLQQKLDTIQSERDTLQQKLDTIQSERDIFKREQDTIREKLNNLQNEYDIVQNDRNALQMELDSLQKNYKDYIEKEQLQGQQLLEKEISQKKLEYTKLELEFNKLTEELNACKNENTSKFKKCEELGTDIQACEMELRRLTEEQKQQTNQSQEQIAQVKTNLKEETDKYLKLSSNQQNEIQRLQEKEQELIKKSEKYSQLENELLNTKIELDKKIKILDRFTKDKESLQSNINIILQEKNAVASKLESCDRESSQKIYDLTNELDTVQKKLIAVEGSAKQISELNNKLGIVKEQKDTCEKQIVEKDIQLSNLEDDLDKLNNNIKDLNIQVEKDNNDLSILTNEKEKLKETLDSQTEKYNQIANKLDQSQRECEIKISQLNEQLIQVSNSLEKCESDNNKEVLIAELNKCNETNLEIQNKLLKIEEARTILEEKWGAKSKELDEQIESSSFEIQQYQINLDKKTSELTELKDQIKQLNVQKNSSDELETIRIENQKTIQSLESQIISLQKELQNSTDEKRSVQSDAEFQASTIESLKKDRDSLQNQIEETQRNSSLDKTKLEQVLTELQTKESVLQNFKQNLETCQVDSEGLINQLDEMKRQVNGITNDSKKTVSELEMQINKLNSELQSRDQEISRLNAELMAREEALVRLKDSLEESISKTKENLSSVASEKETLLKSSEELIIKIKELENKLSNANTELSESKKFEEQLSICNKELNSLSDSFETNTITYDNLQKELDSQIKKYNDINTELATCKNSTLELTKKIEELEQLKTDLSLKDTEIKNLQAKNSELKERVQSSNDLDLELDNLKTELRKVIDERDSILANLASKENQIEEVMQKLNSLKDVCDLETEKLRKEIERLLIALDQTEKSKIIPQTSFAECNKDLENYKMIRESLESKRNIINKVDSIIDSSIYLESLTSDKRSVIKERYSQIKTFMLEKMDTFKFDSLDAQIISEKERNGTVIKLSDSICTNLSILFENWNKSVDTFNKFNEDLSNLFEDLLGAVRVYIRIKSPGSLVSSSDGKFIDFSSSKFGPFFGVFQKDNEDVFYNDQFGLKKSFDQIISGYSTVLFGYGASGSGKCLGKGTEVLMYDGSIKNVEDIGVNDLVMGDDSTPRRVLSTTSGRDHMYKIEEPNGDSYVVNSDHILTLINENDQVVDIPLKEAISKLSSLRGFKVGVEFENKDIDVDPYRLGLSGGLKKIPFNFKCNTRENRLRLLAGLIDNQIGTSPIKNNSYKYNFKSNYPQLLEDTIYLCRSLGLYCSRTDSGIEIVGNQIPSVYLPRRDPDLSGLSGFEIKITEIDEGEYYGFTLDGNCRFVLGNFTVTHNSYTLLGSGPSLPGVLGLGINYLLPHSKEINLKYAFEHYIGVATPTSISGTIINLIDNKLPNFSVYKNFYKDNEVPIVMDKLNNERISLNGLTPSTVTQLIKVIETHRIEAKRIKSTPNNPQSSRSHLFLVFEVVLKNGNRSFFTIIDSAGRESPDDIRETFISGYSLQTAIGLQDIPKDKLKQGDRYTSKDVIKLLKEGVFINETINHLIWFLNKKAGKTKRDFPKQSTSKYNNEAVYITPKSEYSDDNSFVFKQVAPTPNEVILTIPILQFLDNLSEQSPTKFICICNVRQEPKYSNETLATIRFANDIKST